MTYELAEQLKEAGFPQVRRAGSWKYPDGSADDRFAAYEPTLEELIEACGENFKTLDHLPDQNRFVAYSADSIDIDRDGITPTEAVAKLWLALNPNAK